MCQKDAGCGQCDVLKLSCSDLLCCSMNRKERRVSSASEGLAACTASMLRAAPGEQ